MKTEYENDKKIQFFRELGEKSFLQFTYPDDSMFTGNPNIHPGFYWFPLYKINDSIPAIAFDHVFFENNDDRLVILKNIFCSHEIKNITVVPEFNKMYKEDDWIINSPEELLDDLFCSEQFVYDDSHTWLEYSSHEATITFAGEWIV